MKKLNTITRKGKLRRPFMPNCSSRYAVKTTTGVIIDISDVLTSHRKCIEELQETAKKQNAELIILRRAASAKPWPQNGYDI